MAVDVMNESSPSADRQAPPPELRTALSGTDPENRGSVLIDLKLNGERLLFATRFTQMNWIVALINAEQGVEQAFESLPNPTLVLSDRTSTFGYALEVCTRRPAFIAVSEHDASMATYWIFADWVITRPLNTIDPLGSLPPFTS